jgi:hypothetical protein
MQEGAFDEALEGVDAIEHVASPVSSSFHDPQGAFESLTFTSYADTLFALEAIEPAVNGTTGLLNSVLKYGCAGFLFCALLHL